MHVIGTAGHIDHGKSTLIRALTDIDPDRLQAEQERGMTIDLGFAWLTLPSGAEVGIVDVPGHHRFIENMLAGVGGIQFCLFVVAANDGWMPQTQEHMEILDLLGVDRGIVVVTKKDLVDEEWLELVMEDVRERLQGTALADAPLVPVSATTGEGMAELMQMLDEAVAALPAPVDYGRPRLWVDRVFSIRGAGTVATGTLTGGTLHVEQEVHILPAEKRTRVRGLQTHRRSVEQAVPGSRVAVNLTGLETQDLERGDAVTAPDQWRLSQYINVHFRTVPTLAHDVEDMDELKLYVGSAALTCRVRLLNKDVAGAGEDVLAQLWLSRPLPLAFGDRFVLRDATYQGTVGGGRVLDAHAQRVRLPSLRMIGMPDVVFPGVPRERRLDVAHLQQRADIIARGPSAYGELVGVLLAEHGVRAKAALQVDIPVEADLIEDAVRKLAADGRIIDLPSYVIAPTVWDEFARAVRQRVEEYHREYPLRVGIGRETVRTGLGVEARLFDEAVELLVRQGHVAAEAALLRLPEHTVRFSDEQQRAVERVMNALRQEPYSPPSWEELLALEGVDAELLNALVERGDLIKVTAEHVYPQAVVAQIEDSVVAHIRAHGSVDVAALRDLLGTSRKYAVPLLEYLDSVDVTRRMGDVRVLGTKAGTHRAVGDA